MSVAVARLGTARPWLVLLAVTGTGCAPAPPEPTALELRTRDLAPDGEAAAVEPLGSVSFTRFGIDVAAPAALAVGPDGRLYVGSRTGAIHALRIDHEQRAVLDEQLISTLSGRWLLGLSVEPGSSRNAVALWASHSAASGSSPAADSGVISRLSGPGFAAREDVIVGLPRSAAERATNNLRFGRDGRLYIAQGGNTGAGAANDAGTGSERRPEQPLSAALLVADIWAPGFDGDCRPNPAADAPWLNGSEVAAPLPCDVRVFASGLHDARDAVFHSNGEVYTADSAAEVTGTVPAPLSTPSAAAALGGCRLPIPSARIDEQSPGIRSALLLRLEAGGYYGHPNPSRGECLFHAANPSSARDAVIAESGGGDDTLEWTGYPVGTPADPRYRPALFSFGANSAPGGMIEYRSDAFCGELKGELLLNDTRSARVRRLTLSADGRAVAGESTLLQGTDVDPLLSPLPLAQDPLGRLYVGELAADRVLVLEPHSPGCWQTEGVPPLPSALLDASGAELDGEIYVVAGKTSLGPQNTLFIYDVVENAWRRGPDLPAGYPAVENPAVAVLRAELYVFGGSTSAFAGAVSAAARFAPRTQTWTLLPDLPEPRGGATAQAIGDRIYVVGGMHQGVSRASSFIYDAAAGSWSKGPEMSRPRDNPMSAAVGERLFVFGGRTLHAPGSPEEGALSSAERYDVKGSSWSAIAPLPTGRRTGNATVIHGHVLLFGGEGNGTLPQNDLYDPDTDSWLALPSMPQARHGAVAALLGNGVYVIGGGPDQGTSFSADVDVFHF